MRDYRRISSNVLLREEARRAVEALDRAGVPVLVLKGCALVGDILDMDERPASDVDLLVRRRDWRALDSALKRLGAVPHAHAPRVLKQRLYHARSYVTPRGRVVDAHVALADPWRWRVDVEGCFRRAAPFSLAGRRAYRLCAEDLLLHLAMNQAKDDYYVDRKAARDAEAVVERLAPSWEDIVSRAKSWGATVALYLTLEHARRRRNVPVPGWVMDALSPAPWRLRSLQAIVDLDRPRPYRFERHPRRLRQLLVAPLSTDDPSFFPRRASAHLVVGAVDRLLEPAKLAISTLPRYPRAPEVTGTRTTDPNT